MVEATGRTAICSVTFIDIVRYSEESIAQQMAMKARLNGAIARAVDGIAESERIILDTGDGAAICFLGDPEDALFVATAINQDALESRSNARLLLRTGINLGPIKLVVDLNGRTNVVGDGVNVAQRIMSFADEGEILVSRSYYEVVARLTEGNERLFQYMGVRRDKHVREHQLYAFSMHDTAAPERVHQSGGAEQARPLAPVELEAPVVVAPHALSQDVLSGEEQRLARHIGPLARIMIARLAGDAQEVAELRQRVAHLITDPADRSAYLATSEAPVQAAPAASPAPVSASAGEAEPLRLSADEHRLIEQELAQAIGPLARVLVRRALPRAADRAALCEELAKQINNDGDRARFLAAVRRFV